jgi:hypothetical protein
LGSNGVVYSQPTQTYVSPSGRVYTTTTGVNGRTTTQPSGFVSPSGTVYYSTPTTTTTPGTVTTTPTRYYRVIR